MQGETEAINSKVVYVNPAVIEWTRTSSCIQLESASRKTKLSAETIRDFETGKQRPSVDILRCLAKAYRRPLSVFLLKEVPKNITQPIDYRVLGDISTNDPKSIEKLAFEMREALNQRDSAIEIWKELKIKGEQSLPHLSLEINAETAADLLSAALSFEAIRAKQVKSKDLWKGLRRHIEERGILVRQAIGIRIEIMRGYSYHFDELPIIGVNIKDADKAKCFTLLHELTHLALRQNSICDLGEDSQSETDRRTEVYCNLVAGSILVPIDKLREVISKRKYHNDDLRKELVIKSLARFFKASDEVIVRRMVAAHLVSDDFYKAYRKMLSERYANRVWPNSTDYKTNPVEKAIYVNGLIYVANTIQAYSLGLISDSEVVQKLNIRNKHIPQIAELIPYRLTRVVEF